MSTPNPLNLTIEEALKILKAFSCTNTKPINSEAEKNSLRQALLLATSLSDSPNLGICADNATQGLSVLQTYLKALGHEVNLEETDNSLMTGPVYLKFNIQKGSYYFDENPGKYRGVLVSCRSLQDESINGTYGYLPLDLFM